MFLQARSTFHRLCSSFMKILLFEWLSGGGQWIDESPPSLHQELRIQGEQMLKALEEDFSSLGITPILPLDSRGLYAAKSETQVALVDSAQALTQQLCQLAQTADWIILIAPETEGRLARCCEWLSESQQKFLSPNERLVRLFTDKSATCQFLTQNGIPTVDGKLLQPETASVPIMTSDIIANLPGVLKPNDGVGGEGITWIPDQQSLVKNLNRVWANGTPKPIRFERWAPGIPASISVISGPRGSRLLPATRQVLADEPLGAYHENVDNLSPELRFRANQIGKRVAAALNQARGYFGIDLILGAKEADDVVIEINPRMTASYPLLRTITSENLAQAMLDLAMPLS